MNIVRRVSFQAVRSLVYLMTTWREPRGHSIAHTFCRSRNGRPTDGPARPSGRCDGDGSGIDRRAELCRVGPTLVVVGVGLPHHGAADAVGGLEIVVRVGVDAG